jgi:hypothetical protein
MIHRLTIIYFVVILTEVVSQSGRGRNGSACSTGNCAKQDNLFLLVFGITIGVLLLMGCFVLMILCCFGQICTRKSSSKEFPNRLTKEDIERSKQRQNELAIPIRIDNIFESGQWSSRYYRYGCCHGPFLHRIIFNIDQNTVRGNGTDDMGQFTLTGYISTELLTINMIKKYYSSIDDTQDTVGYETKIDLEWNDEKRTFEGKWFTHKYKNKGEGSYELVKVQQSIMNIREPYYYD